MVWAKYHYTVCYFYFVWSTYNLTDYLMSNINTLSCLSNVPKPILSLEDTVTLWKKNRKRKQVYIFTVTMSSWHFHFLIFITYRAFTYGVSPKTPDKHCSEETMANSNSFIDVLNVFRKLLIVLIDWRWCILSSMQISCCLCLVFNCFGR